VIPPVASRFVAGETAPEAIEHSQSLTADGVGAIINLLGEQYLERPPADADTETYQRLIQDITTSAARACLSVKPSQLGLGVAAGQSQPRPAATNGGKTVLDHPGADETGVGTSLFEANLESIVEPASGADVFVWVDMEDHTTTDATLEAYERMAREYGSVGVCLQANLHRTPEDIERLADVPGKVRLVKGAYDEPDAIAYQSSQRVDQAFKHCLEIMFESFDDGIAVGSHDPAMLEHASDLQAEFDTAYEIQMLMGVRAAAQRELARDHEVYQYVPFGSRWLSYFGRRALERHENLRFALRAVLGR